MLDVPLWVWIATVVGILAVVGLDLFIVGRSTQEFGSRQAGRWVIFYIALALAFAGGLWIVEGPEIAGQFVAGWLTEYSLSVDNLFVFVIIMSSFAVPAAYQHRVLLVGILLALVMRAIFIAVGAAAIERWIATFYVFGAFLIFTAVQLVRNRDSEPDPSRNVLLNAVSRVLPTTREYHGTSLIARVDGRRVVTPLLLVMIAIGTTDLLFAVDSIPAIFGLTRDPYLVFAANAFALMGLRQLFFLLKGLLDKLVHLSLGLAVILAFIGTKLIVEALHEQVGEPWPAIPTWLSLVVVIGVLAVTTVTSLASVRRRERREQRDREAADHEAPSDQTVASQPS